MGRLILIAGCLGLFACTGVSEGDGNGVGALGGGGGEHTPWSPDAKSGDSCLSDDDCREEFTCDLSGCESWRSGSCYGTCEPVPGECEECEVCQRCEICEESSSSSSSDSSSEFSESSSDFGQHSSSDEHGEGSSESSSEENNDSSSD